MMSNMYLLPTLRRTTLLRRIFRSLFLVFGAVLGQNVAVPNLGALDEILMSLQQNYVFRPENPL